MSTGFFSVRYEKHGTVGYVIIIYVDSYRSAPVYESKITIYGTSQAHYVFFAARHLQSVLVCDIFFIRDLDLGDQNLKPRFVFEGSVVPQIGKIKSSFMIPYLINPNVNQDLCGRVGGGWGWGGITLNGAHSCIFFRHHLNDRNICS
jgi:hypothetical protein